MDRTTGRYDDGPSPRGAGLLLVLAVVAALGLLALAAVVALRWLDASDAASQSDAATTPADGSPTGPDGDDGVAGSEGSDGDDSVDPAAGSPGPTLPPGAEPGDAVAGELVWRELAPGFETAELPVLIGEVEVERVLLVRLDPSRHRFEVRTRPEGDRDVMDWLDTSGAELALNGSYFDPENRPVTPLVSDSQPAGPSSYEAGHGAFVAATVDGAETAAVVDLVDRPWSDVLAGSRDAMVSYPMLIGDDGRPRTDHIDPTLRANRTFVASDSSGRLVIGATIQGFFALDHLGAFLIDAPLDLTTALNLDGGALSCLAIRLPAHQREFCGQLDTSRSDGRLVVADPEPTDPRPALPIVLLVHQVEG